MEFCDQLPTAPALRCDHKKHIYTHLDAVQILAQRLKYNEFSFVELVLVELLI
jgi:hypothetical protein